MPISELVGSDLKEWRRVRELVGSDLKDWQGAWELQSDGSFKEIYSTGELYIASIQGRSTPATLWRVDIDSPSSIAGDFGRIGSFPTGQTSISGMTDFRGDLYAVDDNSDRLYRVNVDNPAASVNLGELTGRFARRSLTSLFSDGTYLYVLNNTQRIVRRVNPSDPDSTTPPYGSVGSLFAGQANALQSAVYHKGELYVAEETNNRLYRFNLANLADRSSRYGLIGNLPRIGRSNLSPRGMTSDGTHLYVSAHLDDSLWRINADSPSSTTPPYGRIGAFNSGIGSVFAMAFH